MDTTIRFAVAITTFALFVAFAQLASAQERGPSVLTRRVVIWYPADQTAHATLVCVDGEQSCEAHLDDHEQGFSLDTCLNDTEAWLPESEEPFTVLGCSPNARVLVVDVDFTTALRGMIWDSNFARAPEAL
jgi:hypothetical protein